MASNPSLPDAAGNEFRVSAREVTTLDGSPLDNGAVAADVQLIELVETAGSSSNRVNLRAMLQVLATASKQDAQLAALGTLHTDLLGLAAFVDGLESNTTGLATQTTAAATKTAIDLNRASVDAVQAAVAQVKTSVDTLQTTAQGLGSQTTLTAIKAVLDAIQTSSELQQSNTTGLAQQATLAQVQSNTVGLAQQSTLTAAKAVLDVIQTNTAGLASQTTLAAVKTVLDVIQSNTNGLASQSTLAAAKTVLDQVLTTLQGTLRTRPAGTYGYASGVAATTVDVPGGARVSRVSVLAGTGTCTITIAGGSPITLPAGAAFDENVLGDAALGADVVIGGSVSTYYVAWVS